MGVFRQPVESLAGYIEQAKAQTGFLDIPTSLDLAWIDVESGGDISEVTKLDERGFNQVHPDESKDLGLTPAQHKLLTTDKAWSILVGLREIDLCRRRVNNILNGKGWKWNAGDWDYWALVKFYHYLPSVAKELIQKAGPSVNWPDFVAKSLALISNRQVGPVAQAQGAHGIQNADRVMREAIENDASDDAMVRL